MDDAKGDQIARERDSPPAKSLANLKPWKPGQSGNGKGRPKIEPRVRRYARTYDRRMCKVLAEIAEDKEAPMSERRKAAMDLIAVGSGRPELVQQITGRNGEQLGPLVALNFQGGMQGGRDLTPADAYKLMVEGHLPLDPRHEAFQRPAIEQQPAPKDGGDDETVTP
jgi:hypothetical protein